MMDFEPTETQRVVIEAVPESRFEETLTWKDLSQAGLLDPDLGVPELAALLTETGRRAAQLPVRTLMTAALPQARDLRTGVAEGDTLLATAIREPSDPLPAVPSVVTDRSVVTGVKLGISYTERASHILLSATSPDGPVVVAVESTATGITLEPTHTASGAPEHTLRLDGVPVARVLGGEDVVAALYRLAIAGACCVADGAVAGALALTTGHVAAREQFGRPLAAFQAVAQQIADIAIVSRTLHLATVSACWRLAEGLEPDSDLSVAAYWVSSRAPAALRTCHHLHGGTGMDVTYPLHRYSTLVRDLVRDLGGADYWTEHVR